ncbi:MAG TPA: FHA domain-containing protein [Spirochaetia bacterium]|nr:FHA domain-containing protein [Spirochaetia bacterium]
MDETVYKRSLKGQKIKDEEKKTYKLRFKNKTVSITKNILIGRDASNDIVLDQDPLVSRRHAVIEHSEEISTIRDLGSTNGTYVNGNPLKEKETRRLKNGDIIKVGNTEFNFMS